jgi:hypothetical protein
MKLDMLPMNVPMMWHATLGFWGTRPQFVAAAEYLKTSDGVISSRYVTNTEASEWKPLVQPTSPFDWPMAST